VVLFVFTCVLERRTPYLLSTTIIPSVSFSVWMSGTARMRGSQSKNNPLGCILKTFKKGFNGDYRVKLTPDKLKTLCEIDWPAFGVGWPLEGSLDKFVINRVFEVVAGDPGHPD
jgi:hypothetical protein